MHKHSIAAGRPPRGENSQSMKVAGNQPAHFAAEPSDVGKKVAAEKFRGSVCFGNFAAVLLEVGEVLVRAETLERMDPRELAIFEERLLDGSIRFSVAPNAEKLPS
jgi:hypothetical protein